MTKRKWMLAILIIAVVLGVVMTNFEWSVNAKTPSTKVNCQSKKKTKKKVRLNKKSISLAVGGKFRLKLKNAKAKKVKWRSSNKKEGYQ